jgi:hypothetical protein
MLPLAKTFGVRSLDLTPFFLRFHALHCISAAPAALDRYLAAVPAMSLIPFAPFYFFLSLLSNLRKRAVV